MKKSKSYNTFHCILTINIYSYLHVPGKTCKINQRTFFVFVSSAIMIHKHAHRVVSLQNESNHCVCAFITVQDVDTDGSEVGSCQKIISSANAGK